jgi:glycosyltransferase involved in cell wall biosynthesis
MARYRVCLITTVHPAQDARIFLREAQTLAAAGYEVTVVAPSPSGDPLEHVHWKSLPRVRHRALRIALLPGLACWRAVSVRPHVYHLHDPELLWIGLILRTIGCRVVYDAHEDLPEQILSKDWIPRPLRRPLSAALRRWLGFILRRLSGVIAATDGIADVLQLATRPTVVRNYPVLELIPEIAKRPSGPLTRVLYLGQVSEDRGAAEMLDAAHALVDRGIGLTVIGRISPAMLPRLRAGAAAGNVTVVPWKPPLEAYQELALADIGLVCLHPLRRYQTALPVKLFEYMAAGIPVVASDFPLWRLIVEGAECGLLVNPLDASATANAVMYLVDHPEERGRMGRNGRKAVETRYNWSLEAPELLRLYAEVLGQRETEILA